jgi:hypothetical protein
MRLNWVNYQTGVKDIYFRLYAEQKYVSVAIELHHKDAGIRALYFEQFEEFKQLTKSTFSDHWDWASSTQNLQGKEIAAIYCRKEKLSVFNQNQWPEMIAFLKRNMIALDSLWQDIRLVFEGLA